MVKGTSSEVGSPAGGEGRSVGSRTPDWAEPLKSECGHPRGANRGQPGEAFEQAQKDRVRVQTERGGIGGRNTGDSSVLPPSPIQAETCH